MWLDGSDFRPLHSGGTLLAEQSSINSREMSKRRTPRGWTAIEASCAVFVLGCGHSHVSGDKNSTARFTQRSKHANLSRYFFGTFPARNVKG